jgi:hypothetical protein
MTKRSITEKIKIFRRFFTGLKNVYGTYDAKTGKVRQAKEPVTDEVLLAHLTGKQSYGVYLLTGDRTNALAVDFDDGQLCQPIAFQAGARRYGMSAYIERSKSKGYHVWIFFEKPVLAPKARLVAQKILADVGRPETEIFPKQDSLDNKVSYGNFINAPLFGTLVQQGRTVFVDPAEQTKPYPDQWKLLERMQRVPEIRLDAIIESCKLTEQKQINEKTIPKNNPESDDNVSSFGLPPCARKMLEQGISSNQRVVCFRLAIHFKRTGIPYDLTLVTLKAWASKNNPTNGKRIITESEIEAQTKYAYRRSYRSFGCEEPAIAAYCDNSCPVYQHRKTNPSASK